MSQCMHVKMCDVIVFVYARCKNVDSEVTLCG